MATTIHCRCGLQFRITPDQAGRTARCPNPQCRARMQIPPAEVLSRLEGRAITYVQSGGWQVVEPGTAAPPSPAAASPSVYTAPLAPAETHPAFAAVPVPALAGRGGYRGWGAPEVVCLLGIVAIGAALCLPWMRLGGGAVALTGAQFRPFGVPVWLASLLFSLGAVSCFDRRYRGFLALVGTLTCLMGVVWGGLGISRIPSAKVAPGLIVAAVGGLLLLVGAMLLLRRQAQRQHRPSRGVAAFVSASLPALAGCLAIAIGLLQGSSSRFGGLIGPRRSGLARERRHQSPTERRGRSTRYRNDEERLEQPREGVSSWGWVFMAMAMYAAAVSTGAIVWQFVAWRARVKGRVRVFVSDRVMTPSGSGGQVGPFVLFEAANDDMRPVTLETLSVLVKGAQHGLQVQTDRLPVKLQAGDRVRQLSDRASLIVSLRSLGVAPPWLCTAVFSGTAGRKHRRSFVIGDE